MNSLSRYRERPNEDLQNKGKLVAAKGIREKNTSGHQTCPDWESDKVWALGHGDKQRHSGQAEIDKKVSHPTAKRITGTSLARRREIMYPIADIRTIDNHYVQKSANALETALRATGTEARTNAIIH